LVLWFFGRLLSLLYFRQMRKSMADFNRTWGFLMFVAEFCIAIAAVGCAAELIFTFLFHFQDIQTATQIVRVLGMVLLLLTCFSIMFVAFRTTARVTAACFAVPNRINLLVERLSTEAGHTKEDQVVLDGLQRFERHVRTTTKGFHLYGLTINFRLGIKVLYLMVSVVFGLLTFLLRTTL
jgi:hypothetical protein